MQAALLYCCLLAAGLLASPAIADCTVRATGSFPPQANCPASTTLNTTPGQCTAPYTEVFPYIPFPVQNTGINPTTRALGIPGDAISPAWRGCFTSLTNVNSPCAAPSANDPNMVTSRNPAWQPNDVNSQYVSNNPTSGGAGPAGHFRLTLTLDKTLFDYTGVTIEHEGAADNIVEQFSCNGGPTTALPASDFLNANVTPWPRVQPSNCASLQTNTLTTIDYDFENVPSGGANPLGIKINVQGNPRLRSSVVGFTDNCGLPSVDFSGSLRSGTYGLGTTSNTLRVVDIQGSSVSCTYEVTVVDNEPPSASCSSPTVSLSPAGTGTLSASSFTAASTDNCGIVLRGISQSAYTCSDLGVSSQNGFVEDAANLRSPCTGTVTVVDTLPPQVICQAASINLNSAGQARLFRSDVDNGSTDNCAITSSSLSREVFTFADVAASPIGVTMTLFDQSGNSASCVAQVTVVGTLLQGSFDRNSFMYIPEQFTWNTSPDYDASDMVGFYFEDQGGARTDIAANIPFTQLGFRYLGFSRVLPDNDYFVFMTINGAATGEVVTCHLSLPAVDESGILP